MISHSKNFVFIHIFKVAGTSVRSVLNPYCDGLNKPKRLANRISYKSLGKPLFPAYNPPLDGHAKATEYRDFLGQEVYAKYFKFGFARNPYDWQVSMYEYVRQTPHHNQHELIRDMSFDEYINWRCIEEPRLQVDFLHDENENLIVDFIGKFETLEEDFASIMQKLGLTGSLPWMNRTERKPYSDYYNDVTKALVDQVFDRDFKVLGYDKSFS